MMDHDGNFDREANPYTSPLANGSGADSSDVPPSEREESQLGGTIAALSWVPSLYFAEAVPLALVANVSVVMYKDLGVSNTELAAYTSLLYLPWVVKPFWSPIVDIFWTKRGWIVALQLLMAVAIASVGMLLTRDYFLAASLAAMWVLAIGSATHDMAADGFYMLGLRQQDQAIFVGVRSAFYRLGMITTQGLLVILAGRLIAQEMDNATAWSMAFYGAGGVMGVLALYHAFAIPRCERAREIVTVESAMRELLDTLTSLAAKPGVGIGLVYILLYRFAEAQLGKMAQPFLQDGVASGGLAMSVEQVGFIYGIVGVAMLVTGGIVGGLVVARYGLGMWILPMAAAINLPNVVYIYLAYSRPDNWYIVATGVGIEQFGYGFGFAGYMLYMLYLCKGEHETAHYAICTGIMALGMMLPGFVSGRLQEWLGYQTFFIWIMLATIPSFLVTMLVTVDRDFGRVKGAGAQ